MTYLTVPRPLEGRPKEPIPIYMDDETAVGKLLQGMIKLIPGKDYPSLVKSAAAIGSR